MASSLAHSAGRAWALGLPLPAMTAALMISAALTRPAIDPASAATLAPAARIVSAPATAPLGALVRSFRVAPAAATAPDGDRTSGQVEAAPMTGSAPCPTYQSPEAMLAASVT